MADIVRHLLISGRVQGVGFRASMCVEAERLGVRGWVRNRRNGCVEALALGPEAGVIGLLDWSRRGPPGAGVSNVEVSIPEVVPSGISGFNYLPTE